jgi:hypothetical protein
MTNVVNLDARHVQILEGGELFEIPTKLNRLNTGTKLKFPAYLKAINHKNTP